MLEDKLVLWADSKDVTKSNKLILQKNEVTEDLAVVFRGMHLC